MNIFVIGCGRWGSLITWYLDRIGHHVTLYGRKSSPQDAGLSRHPAERPADAAALRGSDHGAERH